MRGRILVLAVGVLSACDDGSCIDGVCPRWDETLELPGPCRGASTAGAPMEFRYGGDVLTRAGLYLSDETHPMRFVGADWSYNADGSIARIVQHVAGDLAFSTVTWTFDGASVRVEGGPEGTRTYDAATFAFLPLVGREVMEPAAELGLLSSGEASYAWTTDGLRRTRRSIPTAERPVVETVVYQLDSRDRILSIARDRESDGTPEQIDQLVYEGDRLVREERVRHERSQFPDVIEWSYDLGGNVVEGTSPGTSYREVFSYECW